MEIEGGVSDVVDVDEEPILTHRKREFFYSSLLLGR